jgi:transposase-like protein
MRASGLNRIRALVQQLNGWQRKVLAAELAALAIEPASVEIVERRVSATTHCPNCSGERIVKNGSASGLQRYLCRGCKRTFNALTGTPLARLHLRGKWLGQTQALRDGLSLSAVQKQLGIARTTAHRWRHRFLTLPKSQRTQSLTGIAESDQTYFLRSAKGQRQPLERASRRRGSGACKPGLSSELVPVLVARDRSGQTADFVLERDTSDVVIMHLAPILCRDAVLCSDSGTVMMAAARKLGVMHRAINLAAGVRVDGPWHIQNANNYHSRLKGWLRKFKGVATRYLDSYLGWFRATDQIPDTISNPSSFLALAIGS